MWVKKGKIYMLESLQGWSLIQMLYVNHRKKKKKKAMHLYITVRLKLVAF